jgi:hypothetical protein
VIRVHVVTSCTDRKKVDPGPSLRLRSVGPRELDPRLREWTNRLAASARVVPARDLYAGEHWFEFLKLLDGGFRPDVDVSGWVLSAGYGLISVNDQVSSYSASFRRQAPDSVSPAEVTWTEKDWWTGLSRQGGPTVGRPRTLSELATSAPEDLILIAASPTYLNAVDEDLRTAMGSHRNMLVFCSSHPLARQVDTLSQYAAFDSRLRAVVGGSQIGLNIRTLAFALANAAELSPSSLRSTVAELMSELPAPRAHDRTAATDDEIRDFVRTALTDDRSLRPTSLLRRWRSMDRACEQGRFRDLFLEVRGQLCDELELR